MAASRFRQGLPGMTSNMLAVLQTLRQAKQHDYPWQPVTAHPRTIRSLLKRDWITESEGPDGWLYTITGRGLHALQVYEAPPRRRTDGICPECGERPKLDHLGYCRQCHNRLKREVYREKGSRRNPDLPCSRCGERPRHITSGGHVRALCRECRNQLGREEKRRRTRRLLERLNRGEFIPCIRCGERSRHHTENSVYDYCQPCFREMQNQSRIRRAYRKHVASRGSKTRIKKPVSSPPAPENRQKRLAT